MQICIIAVGSRMPAWVDQACREYVKRMPGHCRVRLHSVPARKRTRGTDIKRALAEECERIVAATPTGARTIALERTGRQLDTAQLAAALQGWLDEGRGIAFWIGGPEGLAPECVAHAQERWSLSPLTLAHPIVRVLLVEQLYRAWSIIANRPYHR
ncbi:MAG: 23S rRNA (pseudouridine(1915)-N(3))-methyltransferase RlmH [Acidiferrobacterales bacterium]